MHVYILVPHKAPVDPLLGRVSHHVISNEVRAALYPLMPRACKAKGEIWIESPPRQERQFLPAYKAMPISPLLPPRAPLPSRAPLSSRASSPAPSALSSEFVGPVPELDPFVCHAPEEQIPFPLGYNATGRVRIPPGSSRAHVRRWLRSHGELDYSMTGQRYAGQPTTRAAYPVDLTPEAEPASAPITSSPRTPSHREHTRTEDSTTTIPDKGIPESGDVLKFTTDDRYHESDSGRHFLCFTNREYVTAAKAAYEDAFMIHCCTTLGMKLWLGGVPVEPIARNLVEMLERAKERFRALQTMFGQAGGYGFILYRGRLQGALPKCLYRAVDHYPMTRSAEERANDDDSYATGSTLFSLFDGHCSEDDSEDESRTPPARWIKPKQRPDNVEDAIAAIYAMIKPTSSAKSTVEERVVEPEAKPTLFDIETTGSGYPFESTAEQLSFDSTSTRQSTKTKESEEFSMISDTAFEEPEELSDARMEDWSEVPTRQTIDEATPAPESEPESITSTVASYASSIASTITSTISSLCSAVVDKLKRALASL